MSFSRPSRDDDGFALRMAVLYAAVFAFAGVQMPFLPVWLEAKGLDARKIGLVLAAAMLARPVIVPAAMRLIDRYGWAKGPLVAAAWAACATFVTVALSDGFAAIIVAFAISALPQALVLPLADAYALRGLAARQRAYGPVRMWGSGAFIAANLGGGLVLERLGAAQVIWVLVAALAATALGATALVPLATRSLERVASRSGAPSLWRSPVFVAVVAAEASFRQAMRCCTASPACNGRQRASMARPSARCGRSASSPRSGCLPPPAES
jgi:PPP family 3-phenylpropionic acid transporter